MESVWQYVHCLEVVCWGLLTCGSAGCMPRCRPGLTGLTRPAVSCILTTALACRLAPCCLPHHPSVQREWILKVREVKVKKILFHFLFEKWKVKWKSDSLISRMKSEIQMPWDRDREWKVKWKCLEIEIESEKWNENASRSRSRSEISREFSRNS